MTLAEVYARRRESLERLESLGWVFSVKDFGRHVRCYNPAYRDGHTSGFAGEDAMSKAIQFASMAQLRLEKEKGR